MAVRRERVILELEDQFTGPLLRTAAATKAFESTLDDLDRTTVRTDRTLTRTASPSGSVSSVGKQADRSGREIDRFSGRLRLLADTAAILGPALIPIGAVAIPAVTGLAAQFGAAALAGGTALIAFQGVGDALKAVNEAALEPTTENLEKARLALGNLAPEARRFVRELQSMRPALEALQAAAAAGVFPGMTKALRESQGAFYGLEQIMFAVGDAAGDVTAEFAEGIAGPRGREFLAFLENEVPTALTEMGHTVGNLAAGLAELWMAFTPLNRDFSQWLLEASRGFDDWARGLSRTQGFEDFVNYIQTNGPKVADALGAIGNAVLQIVQAAAPLGGPVLDGLTAVADAIAAIADSDAGPAIMATVTALALLRRGMLGFQAVSATTWATNARGANGALAQFSAIRQGALRSAAALAGLGVAASGAADGVGLTNTATGALMGALGGPWGAAIGGAVGAAMDYAASQAEMAEKAEAVSATLNQQTGAITENTREWIKNELYTSGAFEAAERLGIDLAALTEAAMGNESALALVNSQLDGFLDRTTGENARALADTGMQQLNKDATDLKETINGTSGAIAQGRDKIRQFGEAGSQATGRTADGFEKATSSAELFRRTVEEINELLDKRGSFTAYERSLDAFAKMMEEIKDPSRLLNKNGTINIDLPKGQDVRDQLDGIAGAAIRVAESLKGADRIRFLRRARSDFIESAALILGNRDAARELADMLGLVGRQKPKPKIELDGWANAVTQLGKVKSGIDNLHDKTVYVDVVRRDSSGGVLIGGGQTPRDGGQATGGADGMTVPGPRWPYGDKVLAYLAPGEEVVSNRHGQADRNRELLQAINANRYADGGRVGSGRSAGGWASAPSSMRVDLGSLHVTGTLNTPWGPAQVEGIARAAARREVADDRELDSTLRGF